MYSPTRKVSSNGRTVVGQLSSLKRTEVQFESGLEEAFLYILNFDSEVKSFHDQPIQISYKDGQGIARIYTPDFLVEYKNRGPALFEVKSQEFLKKNRAEMEPKFNAAKHFARRKSWEFNIITDKEINTQYCDNVRFLYRYQTYSSDLTIINQILLTLSGGGTTTVNQLIKQISSDTDQWPVYIAAVWTLVLNKQIGCDLFEEMHMETPIWLSDSGGIKKLNYPYL